MKTLQDLNLMSDDTLRVELAELLGWIRVSPDVVPDRIWPCKSCVTGKDGWWMMFPPVDLPNTTGKVATSPPNYPADLNACYQVEISLKDDCPYILALIQVCGSDKLNCYYASARQRTIALIATLQKP